MAARHTCARVWQRGTPACACRYKGDLATDPLVKWGKGIVDGSVEAEFQSEDIPDPDTVDGVKIVVGKTFTQVTTDPTKDVMVEIYAPWCGHCQQLEPIYKELAARFKDIDSVVIAKLDGTANEHKDLTVEGYPTILFFPAGENAESAPHPPSPSAALLLTCSPDSAHTSCAQHGSGQCACSGGVRGGPGARGDDQVHQGERQEQVRAA